MFAAPGLAIGHVTCWAKLWSGLGVLVAVVPSPAPNWPTITSDVGMPLAAPGGTGRLLVKLIVKICTVGTVITTGDQVPAVALKFNEAQVAVEPVAAAPQV